MSRLILITGGSRSGKSTHAQQLAESLPGPRGYVATCPVIDAEMERRVEAHRQDRLGKGWATIEEPVAVAAAIRRAMTISKARSPRWSGGGVGCSGEASRRA